VARGVLDLVASRLLAGAPPHLDTLCRILEGYQAVKGFRDLVQRYLPEDAKAVFAMDSLGDQVSEFCQRFSSRYFPIQDLGDWFPEEDEGDVMDSLLAGIPIHVYGTDAEDLHQMAEWDLGRQLLALLCRNPVDDEEETPGVWLSLLDALNNTLPAELIARVPAGGYPQADLHQMLDGTRFRALAIFADWLNSDTGNLLLDVSEGEIFEQFGGYADWSDAEVHGTMQVWGEARAALDAMKALQEWLEEEPGARLQEVLDFIDMRKRESPLPRQLPLPLLEVFRTEGGAGGQDSEQGEAG
jgi:hypothetical protein